jgi:hypothetical protein
MIKFPPRTAEQKVRDRQKAFREWAEYIGGVLSVLLVAWLLSGIPRW